MLSLPPLPGAWAWSPTPGCVRRIVGAIPHVGAPEGTPVSAVLRPWGCAGGRDAGQVRRRPSRPEHRACPWPRGSRRGRPPRSSGHRTSPDGRHSLPRPRLPEPEPRGTALAGHRTLQAIYQTLPGKKQPNARWDEMAWHGAAQTGGSGRSCAWGRLNQRCQCACPLACVLPSRRTVSGPAPSLPTAVTKSFGRHRL